MPALRVIAFVVMAALTLTAQAGVVEMTNGDRLSGDIVAMEAGELKLISPYAGELTVPWSHVRSVTSDEPLRVLLSDDTRVRGRAVATDAGMLELTGGEVIERVVVGLDKVQAINPPTVEEAARVKTAGRASVGASFASGNADTSAVHVDAEFRARTQDNRYVVGGELDRSTDDGETTQDAATLYARYDHFLSERWFWTNNITLDRNELQDLNLRTTAGAGMGYQFFETDTRQLAATLGMNYLSEDFESAPSDRTAAGRWSLDYEEALLEGRLNFFHNHEGLVSVEDFGDIVIRSRTGFRFPLTDRFAASTQVNYDFDSDPAPSNEEEDIIYMFSLGYEWQ